MNPVNSKESHHVDEEASSPPLGPSKGFSRNATGRGGFKNHCKRFWWIWVIAAVVIALAAVLGLIFGAVPNLVRSSVDKSKIEILNMRIYNPTNNSFTLDMSTRITGTGSFSATIAPMTAELSLIPNGTDPSKIDWSQQKPFATLDLPEIHASHGGTYSNFTGQVVQIKDPDAFDTYGKYLVQTHNFTMGMIGKTTVKPNALKAVDVTLRKAVTVYGMNNLAGIAITNYDLPGLVGKDIDLVANGTIPNVSNTTVFLGDAYFNISAVGFHVGYSVLKNFTLLANTDNYGALQGALENVYLNNQVIVTSALFSGALSGTAPPILVQGTKSVINGQEVGWLSAAAQAISVSVPLSLAAGPPKVVSNIKLNKTEMDFPAPASNAKFGGGAQDADLYTAYLTTGLTSNVKIPFNIPVTITAVGQNLTMVSPDGVTFATVRSEIAEPATVTNSSGVLLITSTATNTSVRILDHDLFGDFLGDVLTKDSATLKLGGSVSTNVISPFGMSLIDGIAVDDSVQLKGLNGFSGQNITVSGVQIVGGKAASDPNGGLQMTAIVSINSASDLTANVGDVTFNVFVNKNKLVGTSFIKALTLSPGTNTLNTSIIMNPSADSQADAEKLLSDFANGTPVTVTLAGGDNTSAVPALVKAFKQLTFDATLPSSGYTFLASSKLFNNNNVVTSTVNLLNPFDAPMTLQRISANLTSSLLGGQTIGTIKDQAIKGVVVPPNTASPGVEQPPLEVDLVLPASAVFPLLQSQKSMPVNVVAHIEVLIGDFLATLDYTANNVTVTPGS